MVVSNFYCLVQLTIINTLVYSQIECLERDFEKISSSNSACLLRNMEIFAAQFNIEITFNYFFKLLPVGTIAFHRFSACVQIQISLSFEQNSQSCSHDSYLHEVSMMLKRSHLPTLSYNYVRSRYLLVVANRNYRLPVKNNRLIFCFVRSTWQKNLKT